MMDLVHLVIVVEAQSGVVTLAAKLHRHTLFHCA